MLYPSRNGVSNSDLEPKSRYTNGSLGSFWRFWVFWCPGKGPSAQIEGIYTNPEGPSTQYLRILVLNTTESMVFGTKDLKYWLLGPSEKVMMSTSRDSVLWVVWTLMDGPVSATGIVPKAPCTEMVTTWALKGLLYHDFGAYAYTIVVVGAFGSRAMGLSKPT